MECYKVIWGSYWDPLLAKDKTGQLVKIMNETVDGEYQAYKARNGLYVRNNFWQTSRNRKISFHIV